MLHAKNSQDPILDYSKFGPSMEPSLLFYKVFDSVPKKVHRTHGEEEKEEEDDDEDDDESDEAVEDKEKKEEEEDEREKEQD
ncbi:hypothetical protein PoB_001119100 [Plakobranchus ocellatus]|uniref:Uncharacterized protein n=1 Tax=Plakobranchus ocellatus TaxID=259542 RepID=A0AAV3YQI7_9GAST|nr:hypothetical protein PoB_001119100 [Plakobranchus ocellatus]